ncbi:MAG: GSCFA domain-containing protein [Bernardetiaceae bacterium]|nr:GSCFA domain-containing protein [Bernardetiaceae bacterium]
MNFRTQLELPNYPMRFGLSHRFFATGSCFAQHIGARLENYKFEVSTNPWGIIFHPLALLRLLSGDSGTQKATFLHDDNYFHPYYHSDFSADSEELLMAKIQIAFEASQRILSESDCLLLTFGTAWGYYHHKSKIIVANCHKQPAADFEKKLTSPEEILDAFSNFYERCYAPRPIVLTLSPVRHLKDTLPLNAVSKSVLRLAIHHICEKYVNVHYFPAYEWLIDDLRDYRFYQKDMLHPNEIAVDYIWQNFVAGLLDAETQNFIKDWTKIRLALAHRPFNPTSEAHQKFLKALLKKLNNEKRVDTSIEQKSIKAQILG